MFPILRGNKFKIVIRQGMLTTAFWFVPPSPLTIFFQVAGKCLSFKVSCNQMWTSARTVVKVGGRRRGGGAKMNALHRSCNKVKRLANWRICCVVLRIILQSYQLTTYPEHNLKKFTNLVCTVESAKHRSVSSTTVCKKCKKCNWLQNSNEKNYFCMQGCKGSYLWVKILNYFLGLVLSSLMRMSTEIHYLLLMVCTVSAFSHMFIFCFNFDMFIYWQLFDYDYLKC